MSITRGSRIADVALRWGVPSGILALAALLRFWNLSHPQALVFDELFYVRDAITQMHFGYPTRWPDNDPAFDGERARAFTDFASNISHPPLGKWLIALGIAWFGVESGAGWRSAVAIAGIITIALTMRLGHVLSANRHIGWLAGLLLAIDGVHVVLTRVSMLDGFLTLFVVAGALCILLDLRRQPFHPRVDRYCGGRVWLLLAGLSFGAAAAVKWSGAFAFLAFLGFALLAEKLRLGTGWGEDRGQASFPDGRRAAARDPWRRWFVTIAIAIVSSQFAYLLSWSGWIATTGGAGRRAGVQPWGLSLWQWHLDSLLWHTFMQASHPHDAHPLTWPLALHPTLMYYEIDGDAVSMISPLPNPLVTLAGVVALIFMLWLVLRTVVRAMRSTVSAPLTPDDAGLGQHRAWQGARYRAAFVSGFVLLGYLSGWLPWVLIITRSTVYQFYAVVLTPFAALALALTLGAFASWRNAETLCWTAGMLPSRAAAAIRGRRIALGILLAVALVLAFFFWPLWAGFPVSEEFVQVHRWLPGW